MEHKDKKSKDLIHIRGFTTFVSVNLLIAELRSHVTTDFEF